MSETTINIGDKIIYYDHNPNLVNSDIQEEVKWIGFVKNYYNGKIDLELENKTML